MNQDEARRVAEEMELPEGEIHGIDSMAYSESQVREAIASALVKLTQQEERVQELERVLGVARDHITLLSRIANIDHTGPCASIAAIEAALSKETGK